mmetsp:Transcript_5603/g.20382  ORF Transcript_5603/g.20382 Transcript_5603/m.20382 type:complete len:113 (-) Transcript_5603:1187-1525(-)
MALAVSHTIATPLRVANSRRTQMNTRRAPVCAMADANRRAVSFGLLATVLGGVAAQDATALPKKVRTGNASNPSGAKFVAGSNITVSEAKKENKEEVLAEVRKIRAAALASK